jgi:hypothetical protein
LTPCKMDDYKLTIRQKYKMESKGD